jgi:hypothetical protein
LVFTSTYALSNLELEKISGNFINTTQFTVQGADIEVSISSLHPGGFDGQSFYGRSCLNKKVLKGKVSSDGSFELPAIDLENPYSSEYCLDIKFNHLKIDHKPTLHTTFVSELDYLDAVKEIYLEKTYVDSEKMVVKVPNGLTFKDYVKEVLEGTSLFENDNYTWEISMSYNYKSKDASNLRQIPFMSDYNTLPCKMTNITKKCIATKGKGSATSKSKNLYSTLSSKGNNIYHLVSKPMGPLREFISLNYDLELSVWNLNTGNRDYYTKINPRFNQSQLNSGYRNYVWGNVIPSKTLLEHRVELNSDISHLNKVMRSKINN